MEHVETPAGEHGLHIDVHVCVQYVRRTYVCTYVHTDALMYMSAHTGTRMHMYRIYIPTELSHSLCSHSQVVG